MHKNGANNPGILYFNAVKSEGEGNNEDNKQKEEPEEENPAFHTETIITNAEAASMGLVNIANFVTSSDTQEIIVENIDFDALQMQQHFLVTPAASSAAGSTSVQLCKLR